MNEASKRKGKAGSSAVSPPASRELEQGSESAARTAPGGAKAHLNPKRGRPKKGERAEGSTPRSVRLSDRVWERLEAEAERRGETVHALLREAIARWLERDA